MGRAIGEAGLVQDRQSPCFQNCHSEEALQGHRSPVRAAHLWHGCLGRRHKQCRYPALGKHLQGCCGGMVAPFGPVVEHLAGNRICWGVDVMGGTDADRSSQHGPSDDK